MTFIIGSLTSPYPKSRWTCQPCIARAAASLRALPDPGAWQPFPWTRTPDSPLMPKVKEVKRRGSLLLHSNSRNKFKLSLDHLRSDSYQGNHIKHCSGHLRFYRDLWKLITTYGNQYIIMNTMSAHSSGNRSCQICLILNLRNEIVIFLSKLTGKD